MSEHGVNDVPFFAGLPPEDAATVGRLAWRATFAPGSVLFEHGDAADAAYFLTDGQVELSLRLPGGGERPLARVGPGEVLGELALVEHHHRSATARAVGHTEALVIARSDLKALCAQRHPVSLELLMRLARLVAERVSDSIRSLRDELGDSCERPTLGPTAPFAPSESGLGFDLRPFAPKLELLREFSTQDVAALLAVARPWSLSDGRQLWREGEASRSCFVIVRGAVRLDHEATGDRIAVVGPGKLVGAASMLLDRLNVTSARVVERASVLELTRDAFASLSDPSSHLSFRFTEAMVRGLMERLTHAGRAAARRAHRRLAGVQQVGTHVSV